MHQHLFNLTLCSLNVSVYGYWLEGSETSNCHLAYIVFSLEPYTKATFTPGSFRMAASSFSLRIFLSFLTYSETSSVIMILFRFGPYGLFFKIDGALRKI